ncbi:MAG: hypothetical protein RLZZ40_410 [Actinomycetota bacterium]
MRGDDFGEDRLHTVRLGDRVIPMLQSAFSHEHGVTDQSTPPHRENGSQSGLQPDSTFEFGAQHLDHRVVRERLDDIRTN